MTSPTNGTVESTPESTPESRPESEIDLFNPDGFVGGVPHHMFTWLRRNDPVHYQREPGLPGYRKGYWAVTRHADIIAMSRDPATFSSHWGSQLIDFEDENDVTAIRMMMLNMDPPQHVRYRNLVKHGFIPRIIAELEPRIRRRVRAIVDSIAWKGECDFVTDVATRLPLEVIAEVIGVPEADRPRVFDWTNRLIGFDDPEFQTTIQDGRDAAMCMWQYAMELAEERGGGDGDDLVSVLMRAQVDGEKLGQTDFTAFFLLLAVAGNETTRNAISGGMLALLEHPGERARLLGDPRLLGRAVDEMLRWVTPVVYMRRTATRDVVVRGKTIHEGDKLAMYYSSANRDEDVFADADRFDVGRHPNEHLAFGTGQHVCIGAALARLELRLIFEELLGRVPDLRLAAPVRRLRSNFINGIKEMPVRFTPEHALVSAAPA